MSGLQQESYDSATSGPAAAQPGLGLPPSNNQSGGLSQGVAGTTTVIGNQTQGTTFFVGGSGLFAMKNPG